MPTETSLNHILGSDALYLTIGLIFSFVLTLALILRSGHGYSQEDAKSHSSNYGGVIEEGHGGLTAFLWIFYAAMFIWTIVYLVQHGSEFAIIFAC